MTHRVNAAAFRIGKSLNWHSLGSPLYRWRDLKINLFLNYFLARFLERESYRLVRYGVRSENKFFKIVIIAFRIINNSTSLPRGATKSYFETYWNAHNIFKYRFRLGVFRYMLHGLEERMTPPLLDAVGIVHTDKARKFFSIGPLWNWNKTFIFLTDGVHMDENEPGESDTIATYGFSAKYHIRMAAKLMILRYAIRKSTMRIAKRRIMPPAFNIISRSVLFGVDLLRLENFFNGLSLASSNCKNFLFYFLAKKVSNKSFLKNIYLKGFSSKIRSMVVKSRVLLKSKRMRRRLSKLSFLKSRADYRTFSKLRALSWKRARRAIFLYKKKSFRRGRYNLKKYFNRLQSKKKSFKAELVYARVRVNKNKLMRRFFNYKKIFFLKKKIRFFQNENKVLFSHFFSGLLNFIFYFNSFQLKIKNLLIAFIFKKIGGSRVKKSVLGALKTACAPISRIFPVYCRSKKKGVFAPRLSRLNFKRFYKLYLQAVRKRLGTKIVKAVCQVSRGFKKSKKNWKNYKMKFFFYFFFKSMAVFKFYKLKFKPDSLKQLYRKKKLIFSIERRLSAFLKINVMLKFFNPLSSCSMDDLWTKSLLDSLNFISNMYLRDRLDYKPAFILSLYTMLAFKYSSPAFLGAFIANQLEWRWRKRSHSAFIRLLIYFFKGLKFNTMYTKNLANFSVGFYGKVWGKLRAGKFIIRSFNGNALALRRVSLKMDTSFTWAESQFGTFGIRIWITRN